MKGIKDLLARYAHIRAPDATRKKVFVDVVEQELGISLTVRQVSIDNHTVYISAPSVIKNEIKLNQRRILKKVNEAVHDVHALTSVL